MKKALVSGALGLSVLGAAVIPATSAFGNASQRQAQRCEQLVNVIQLLRAEFDSASDPNQPPPSTAEYLDAVRACLQFEVTVDETSEIWKAINTAVLEKKAQGTGAA